MTLRYRVIADDPTYTSGGTHRAQAFSKGDILINPYDNGDAPRPDPDGDVWLVLESDETVGSNIKWAQVELVTDTAPADDDFVPFETYEDAAERLGLSDEFRRVAQLAEALHIVATATPKKETSA